MFNKVQQIPAKQPTIIITDLQNNKLEQDRQRQQEQDRQRQLEQDNQRQKQLEQDRERQQEQDRQRQVNKPFTEIEDIQNIKEAQLQAQLKAQRDRELAQEKARQEQLQNERKAQQDAAALKAQQDAAALKAQQDAALKAQQDAALKAQQDAALKAQQDAALKAQQDAVLKAQQTPQADIDIWIREHNKLRNDLGLDPVKWNEDLVTGTPTGTPDNLRAKDWVNKCIFGEMGIIDGTTRPKLADGTPIAQTMAFASPAQMYSPKEIFNLWKQEGQDYDYATGKSRSQNFPYIINPNVTEIGCACSNCQNNTKICSCRYTKVTQSSKLKCPTNRPYYSNKDVMCKSTQD